MNRILLSLSMFTLLFGCQQPASVQITEQTLQWPLLDEVSDIRSQICMLGGHYFIATDRSVYQLNDSNEDTKPILLFNFPDSLWKTITDLEYPYDTAYTPEEFGSNYTRGMPDFLIEKVHVLDEDHLMLFLAFNSLTKNHLDEGYVLNKDTRTWSLNIHSKKLEPIPYQGYKQAIVQDTIRIVHLEYYYPIINIKTEDKSLLYTADICTQQPGTCDLSSLIACYDLQLDSVNTFNISTLPEASDPGKVQLIKNYQLLGIQGYRPHRIMYLDTSKFNGLYPYSAIFHNKSERFVVYSYMRDANTSTYYCRLDIIDLQGNLKTVWEKEGINVLSPDIHGDEEHGYHLIYDKEGEIVQVNVLAQ